MYRCVCSIYLKKILKINLSEQQMSLAPQEYRKKNIYRVKKKWAKKGIFLYKQKRRNRELQRLTVFVLSSNKHNKGHSVHDLDITD